MGGLDERFKVAYEDIEFATRLKNKMLRQYLLVMHPFATLGEP